jgi:hypothetical protein
VPHSAGSEPRPDLRRSSRHVLYHSSRWGRRQRTTAQHEHGLLSIGPGIEGPGRLVRCSCP